MIRDGRKAVRQTSAGSLARWYDTLTRPLEGRWLARWREAFWRRIPAGGRGLEFGVGTGANLPYRPPGAQVVAMDLSLDMTARARAKAEAAGSSNALHLVADVQRLPFRQGAFDWAGGTLVFCEVTAPESGIAELARVVRPEGRVVLLEHVRPRGPLGLAADLLTRLTAPLWGEHWNRDPERYVVEPLLPEQERVWLFRRAVVLLVLGRRNADSNL